MGRLVESGPVWQVISSGYLKNRAALKLSAEGADVEIEKSSFTGTIDDDTISDVGVLKSGGQTAAKDAPGRKGRLEG